MHILVNCSKGKIHEVAFPYLSLPFKQGFMIVPNDSYLSHIVRRVK